MSRWVKKEYEGVLAFLFIAIGTFIPWNVTVANLDGLGRMYAIRWWIGETRYLTSIAEFNGWQWVHESIQMQAGQGVFPGYVAWGVGTALFTIALAFGVALFFREETLSEQYPVRLLGGGILTLTGAAYIIASTLISVFGIPGVYIPIGGVIHMVFGVFLLTNQFKSDTPFSADATDEQVTETEADTATDLETNAD